MPLKRSRFRLVKLRAGVAAVCVIAAIVGGAVAFSLALGVHAKPAVPIDRPTQNLVSSGTVFALQPFGRIPSPILERHAQLLRERFGAQVEVLAPRPLPPNAYDGLRRQYRADLLLDALYVIKPSDATHVVGVTAEDLYAEGWDFLYGFSQIEGQVAIYSLARVLAHGGDGLSAARTSLERIEKVIVHEVGHTFDVGHCERRHCVMNTVDTTPEIDHMSRFFCRRCAQRIHDHRQAVASSTPRGDGLFRRGAFDRAWMRYTIAALKHPTNAVLVNRLGVSSAAAGSPGVAELSYRLAIAREPEFSLPYYNFGLLFAAVDAERAVKLLQAGFARDPDRVEALGFLGTVYLEVLADEHKALWYFQRYVGEGGQNPDILYRYRGLIQPAIFELNEKEPTIIHGHYEDGLTPFVDAVLDVERLIAVEDGFSFVGSFVPVAPAWWPESWGG